MPPREPSGPDLSGVVADANAVGLEFVVIGGFSVIFHGYIRATMDSDLLIPDGSEADTAILRFLERADGTRLRDEKVFTLEDVAQADNLRIASLPSIVGFKRLAGRPRDRTDLAELEAIYGDLPIEPIPGLDDPQPG